MNKSLISILFLLLASTVLNAQKADEQITNKGLHIYSLPDVNLYGLKMYNGQYLYLKRNEDIKLYDRLNAEFKAFFGDDHPRTVVGFKLNNNGLLIDVRILSDIQMDQEKVYSFLSKVVSEKIIVQLEPFVMFDPDFIGKDYYVVYYLKLGDKKL
ncbi:MAG: hypothetical protein MI866_14540 [Bacteroidales bacterium]|nr:hypothetical protein [Bacteroidales bacterium]